MVKKLSNILGYDPQLYYDYLPSLSIKMQLSLAINLFF